MEDTYNCRFKATSGLICSLEGRIQQLTADAENSTKLRCDMEEQRAQLEGRVETLQADSQDLQAKHTVLDRENAKLKAYDKQRY